MPAMRRKSFSKMQCPVARSLERVGEWWSILILRDAGFAAAVQQALSGGKQIYAVRIAGLLSEADGVAVAAKLRIQLRLQNVSVSLN